MERGLEISSTLKEVAEKLIPELLKSVEEMLVVSTSPSFYLSKNKTAEGFLTIGRLNHSGEEEVYILQKK